MKTWGWVRLAWFPTSILDTNRNSSCRNREDVIGLETWRVLKTLEKIPVNSDVTRTYTQAFFYALVTLLKKCT